MEMPKTYDVYHQLWSTCVKTRNIIGVMMLMACFTIFVMKTNISIALIAMVEPPNITYGVSYRELPNYGPRFYWHQVTQSKILISYYYGYTLTTLIGGTLAEKFGGRNVVGCSIIIGSMLTMAHPQFAGRLSYLMIDLRFALGLALGVCIPACHTLISKWAPPNEKGKFVATLLGGTLGTVVTFPVTNLLIIHSEWRIAFYLEGLFCLIFAFIWFTLVTDDPNTHWFIKQEEKNYINESLQDKITVVKKIPPFVDIFSSITFFALVLLHFGNAWGLLFVLSYLPKYISLVMHYDMKDTYVGFLGSLPNLARFVMAFVFGSVADEIRKHEKITVTETRRLFCITSHILPGLFLVMLALSIHTPWLAILLMTLSLGFNGSAVVTNLQNSHDLAPNYAGTLFSFLSFFGNVSHFIGAIVVVFITNHDIAPRKWAHVFFVGGMLYILTAIIYIHWGSGEIQEWNYSKEDKLKYENLKNEKLKNEQLKDENLIAEQ